MDFVQERFRQHDGTNPGSGSDEQSQALRDAHRLRRDHGHAIKRQHEPPRIVGDLLTAEIAEKQARSIKYQMTRAKLPLANDIDDFDFSGTPINEALVRELIGGTFVADQRNVVLVGGFGTGKSHLAIAIARALIRNSSRGRFFNVVDLVNWLEPEHRIGKQGRFADYLISIVANPRNCGSPHAAQGAVPTQED
jgi:DNA replication protein DnaC